MHLRRLSFLNLSSAIFISNLFRSFSLDSECCHIMLFLHYSYWDFHYEMIVISILVYVTYYSVNDVLSTAFYT